jgi:hypothetical protein
MLVQIGTQFVHSDLDESLKGTSGRL